MIELRQVETRWATWGACIHEAGHLVSAIGRGRGVTGAFILGSAQAYSRCDPDAVVFAAGDIAVKLSETMGTTPPDGAPKYFDGFLPPIPVKDDAGARLSVTIDTTPDTTTPAPTLFEIRAQAESVLRENWFPLVEIASALFLRGYVTGREARRFMLGLSWNDAIENNNPANTAGR